MTMLNKNAKSNSPRSFKKSVIKIFDSLKNEKRINISPVVPIYSDKYFIGYLRAITKSSFDNEEEIKKLAEWRKKYEKWFPAQFKVTVRGTKVWLKERLLDAQDRFLFMIETPSSRPIGHLGFFRFDFKNRACEIDNVIRGESDYPGIMTHSLNILINFAKNILGVKDLYLEVFSDNKKAIALYERCGFKEIKRMPLKKVVSYDKVSWVEIKSRAPQQAERYNSYMKLYK